MVCSLLKQVCNRFTSTELLLMFARKYPRCLVLASWRETQDWTWHATSHDLRISEKSGLLTERVRSLADADTTRIGAQIWKQRVKTAILPCPDGIHVANSNAYSQGGSQHSLTGVLLDPRNILSSNRFCHGEQSPCEKDVPSLNRVQRLTWHTFATSTFAMVVLHCTTATCFCFCP
jgi:hypothetical protein